MSDEPLGRDAYLLLRRLLESAADAYYRGLEPVMDDAEYDLQLRRLAATEAAHPEWAGGDPFSGKVGSARATDGQVRHATPMLSLDNIFSLDELRVWRERLGAEVALQVEPKLDGLAVAAVYRQGRLQRLATRGDGSSGEDVTAAPVIIAGLPEQLTETVDVEVRGEVCMTASDFQEANRIRAEQGQQPLSSPRNGAAGAMLSLPGRRPVPVTFWAYDLVGGGDLPDAFARMRRLGLNVSLDVWTAEKGEDPAEAVARLQRQRADLPVSIDGAVLKAARAEDRNLGSTSRAPRWAVAYKFPAEMRRSRITAIDLQVGRGGSITPVARIEPVSVGGAVVASVNLHNPNDIARKDLRVGDVVYVRRAGDVIPEIVGAVVEERGDDSEAWKAPDSCPQCGGAVQQGPGRLRCLQRCGRLRGLVWAAGRQALDIDGCGAEMLAAAAQAGLVVETPDLYLLSEAADRMADLQVNGRRFGEARARRVAEAASEARNLPQWRHLVALGLEHVGTATAKALMQKFGTLEELTNAEAEELVQVEGVGRVVADSIRAEIRERREEILKVAGFAAAGAAAPGRAREGRLEDLKVAVTGSFRQMSRKELIGRIEDEGGRIVGSVSAATSLLVRGEGGGSKIRDAQRHGVTMVDEERIMRILDGKETL